MIIGNRIPHTYFVTDGIGESDNTIHAGSYHLALREAGIENCNIITYSSILPARAKEIPQPARESFVHGSVMESIMAVASCVYGETATAGLTWAWLSDPTTHQRFGGLVCEYSGPLHELEVIRHLEEMMQELYTNGYEHLTLGEPQYRLRSVTPTKMYGTALVSISFTSYELPYVPSEWPSFVDDGK